MQKYIGKTDKTCWNLLFTGGESVGSPVFSPENISSSRTCTMPLTFTPLPLQIPIPPELPFSEFCCPSFLSAPRRGGQWKPLLLPSAFSTIIGAPPLQFLLPLPGLATRTRFSSTLSSWCRRILPTVG